MMHTLYIDESGTYDVKNNTQPIYLFGGVIIENEKIPLMKLFMDDILLRTKNNILQCVQTSIEKNKYDINTAKKITEMIAKKVLYKFEIHCSELLRGDNCFMIMRKEEREQIVIDILEFIRTNNIKVIVVYCVKQDILDDKSIPNKDKDKALKEKVSSMMWNEYTKFTKDIKSSLQIITDSDNKIIENFFIPYCMKNHSELINGEVIQKESHLVQGLQVADVVAYIVNWHLRVNNSEDRKSAMYEIIKDNIIYCNIYDEDEKSKLRA